MVASEQKKWAGQGKPHVHKNLTHFKLRKHEQSMVIREEALLYIAILKLKIETLQREYEEIKRKYLHQFQEMKVEKIGERFQVKIKSLEGDNKLVNILEAFEKLGLIVGQARVSCRDAFVMEAIVVPKSEDKLLSVDDMTQTLVKALNKQSAPL